MPTPQPEIELVEAAETTWEVHIGGNDTGILLDLVPPEGTGPAEHSELRWYPAETPDIERINIPLPNTTISSKQTPEIEWENTNTAQISIPTNEGNRSLLSLTIDKPV